jgi:PAS domain S-box-containing protein
MEMSRPNTAERARLAGDQPRFFEAALSSIPDFVYAFDRDGRFTYVNAAMLALFGTSTDELLGKTFAELGYPTDLTDRLNAHLRHVFAEGVTVEDEVLYKSAAGYSAYFSFLWGPVRGADGSIELVVGVSRNTSQRHRTEVQLRQSEARLRAATELVGVGIYSWDPATGKLEWDDLLRQMWGLRSTAQVDMDVFQSAIHPGDLPRVQHAIRDCADPGGSGLYNIEYRVIGRDDGVTRHIATKGQMSFSHGRAARFVGAAIDVTMQRRTESAIRASELQFRSFADHSSNLIWIGDPAQDAILYRSAAYERIWGQPRDEATDSFAEWLKDVHEDDREQVKQALAAVKLGEVTKFDYRLVRPADRAIRRLHDTSFPILDENGAVWRIGGITEDVTPATIEHVYVVSSPAVEARRLANILRAHNYRVRVFPTADAFLEIAQMLAPGCVLVDVRKDKKEGIRIPRELKTRSIPLPTVVLDSKSAEVDAAVSAMKAGAADYLMVADESAFQTALVAAIGECALAPRPATLDESATGRLARLTPREHDVLVGLVGGGTNKTIALKLGISPRTVELHRAQVMNRLDASSLTELLQIALASGLGPVKPRTSI